MKMIKKMSRMKKRTSFKKSTRTKVFQIIEFKIKTIIDKEKET